MHSTKYTYTDLQYIWSLKKRFFVYRLSTIKAYSHGNLII